MTDEEAITDVAVEVTVEVTEPDVDEGMTGPEDQPDEDDPNDQEVI